MLASGLANGVLAQHFVLGVFAYLLGDFGGLLKKLLFLGGTFGGGLGVLLGEGC